MTFQDGELMNFVIDPQDVLIKVDYVDNVTWINDSLLNYIIPIDNNTTPQQYYKLVIEKFNKLKIFL